jgi:molybdopterin-synthase adenylyltransferase
LGSGGSQIALELAKAGIGEFTLVDFDRIDLSNVARHVAGVNDLGRLKTNVMREAILQKNPAAKITLLNHDVDAHLPEISQALNGVDVLIAATDNNRSRFNLNALALEKRIPMLVGRATTRAAGGDVLRVRPYKGPCYACLFGAGLLGQEERSSMRQLRPQTPAYVPDADVQATIQVGLASDIAPIANMVVKLALVELSRGLESGLKSLEIDLAADFYLWGNRREDIFAKWQPLGYGFQQNTILRWYGVRVNRNPNCPACGEQTQAPVEGEDFFS